MASSNRPGRISVDVNDLRDKIDKVKTSNEWRELPLASKVRVLLMDALKLEGEN